MRKNLKVQSNAAYNSKIQKESHVTPASSSPHQEGENKLTEKQIMIAMNPKLKMLHANLKGSIQEAPTKQPFFT